MATKTYTFEKAVETGNGTTTFVMEVIDGTVSEWRIGNIIFHASKFHNIVDAYSECQTIATDNEYTTPDDD